MKTLYSIVPALFCIVTLSNCAAKDEQQPQHVAVEQQEAVIIAPSSFHEACDKLTPGQQIKYSFETTLPVDFNVHYHSKTAGIVYPVKEDNVTSSSGELTADVQAIYCCMWSNKQSAPISLTYEFTTVGK
jgi:hypothetical protein